MTQTQEPVRETSTPDGHRLHIAGGYFYAPTVLADVADDARVVQEEIFGPVLDEYLQTKSVYLPTD